MRKFTQDELKKILDDHKLWLENKGGNRADLSYADLRYADLSYADLRYAYLSCADLRYADLSYADLRSTNLRSADLRYADLSYADLRSANLSSANLRSTNLSCADLRSTNLRSADLSYAYLRCADLPKGIYIFQGNKHQAIASYGRIRIGCQNLSIEEWLKKYKEIGKDADYDNDDIKDYGNFIKWYAKKIKLLKGK